jgi:hypothetical protein
MASEHGIDTKKLATHISQRAMDRLFDLAETKIKRYGRKITAGGSVRNERHFGESHIQKEVSLSCHLF